MTTNNEISPVKFCYNTNLTFLYNHQDPSYKTDQDFLDCYGRKKSPSDILRNTVTTEDIVILSYDFFVVIFLTSLISFLINLSLFILRQSVCT